MSAKSITIKVFDMKEAKELGRNYEVLVRIGDRRPESRGFFDSEKEVFEYIKNEM